jgi:hypothetical protein
MMTPVCRTNGRWTVKFRACLRSYELRIATLRDLRAERGSVGGTPSSLVSWHAATRPLAIVPTSKPCRIPLRKQAASVWAIRQSSVVVIASLEGVLDMDENRCREGSAKPPVSGRDDGRLEGEKPANAEDLLRRKARAAIRAGMLSRHHQVSIWGGPGSGASCAVCGDPAAWDAERRSLLQADSNSGTISDRERLEP